MGLLILLDAGPLGLACRPPEERPAAECRGWLAGMAGSGAEVAVPIIADYEVRRELLRLGAAGQIRALDALGDRYGVLAVTPEAWGRAAGFWALLRRAGRPTADPHALDADALLAGIAATVGGPGDEVVVATTNAGHLGRFPGVDARDWRSLRR